MENGADSPDCWAVRYDVEVQIVRLCCKIKASLWVFECCDCVFNVISACMWLITCFEKYTFIGVEDWKHSPEAQHDVNLEHVVDDDTDNEENHHTTKQGPNRNQDVWICRDKHHRMLSENFFKFGSKRLTGQLIRFLWTKVKVTVPSPQKNKPKKKTAG